MVTASGAVAALPLEVRDLAARLGARGDPALSVVTLRQRGTMRDPPAGRAMRFTARQTICLRHSAFTWRASTGPFGSMSVTDAFKDETGVLEVRALGLVRVAGASGGAALAKGEVMRYLAELAWAPDAMLVNPSLVWTVVDSRTLRVGAGHGEARGEVELRLDEHGRIDCISANDRPRKEGTVFVERAWVGRFFDYQLHHGRWLPFAGEVGWVLDGQTAIAWRGTILSWAIA
jgi:hypothetical protein